MNVERRYVYSDGKVVCPFCGKEISYLVCFGCPYFRGVDNHYGDDYILCGFSVKGYRRG